MISEALTVFEKPCFVGERLKGLSTAAHESLHSLFCQLQWAGQVCHHHTQHSLSQRQPLRANGRQEDLGVSVSGVPSTDLQAHAFHYLLNLLLIPATILLLITEAVHGLTCLQAQLCRHPICSQE